MLTTTIVFSAVALRAMASECDLDLVGGGCCPYSRIQWGDSGDGGWEPVSCCPVGTLTNEDDLVTCECTENCENASEADDCIVADIVDAEVADNVIFRYKDGSRADLASATVRMQNSRNGGATWFNWGAGSKYTFEGGFWVTEPWSTGLNWPQRMLIDGEVVHTWDTVFDATYKYCEPDTVDDKSVINTLAGLHAWCDASHDNCEVCRGEYTGVNCYTKPDVIAKCRKFKGTEACDMIVGCKSVTNKKGKVKCKGKKHGLA